jgi:ABC-type dipeptide/oligopeptide/nickel transport system permease component
MARDLLDLFSMKNWRFSSWSLAATIASALVLVSVVHLFLFPLTPSFNYFKLASDSCVSTNASEELISKHGWDEPAINLKHQFPADLHGSVAYKGAPWKAEMGRWLAGCDSITKEVNISEVISDILILSLSIFFSLFLFLVFLSCYFRDFVFLC